jgi:hypothetical protein
MRKLTIALGITALSLGAAAAPANATRCVDFVNFCDGFELSVSGAQISGEWVNNDCAGARAAVSGHADTGRLNVNCQPAGSCPAGIAWFFKLDTVSQLFVMYGTTDNVNFFLQQANQPFRVTEGACSFSDDMTGIPSSLKQ